MQHQEAVYTIASLAGELSKNDPSAVLIKHATEHDYSPAILQKLGQVYNMGLTISNMEKNAEDRGSAVDIIDTVELMKSFMRGSEDLHKHAYVQETQSASENIDYVNLNRVFDDAVKPAEVIEKAAATFVVETEPEVQISLSDVEAIEDLQTYTRLQCEKSASNILQALEIANDGMSSSFDISSMENDARLAKSAASVAQARTYLEAAAANQHISRTILPRSSDTLYKRAFVVETSQSTQDFLNLVNDLATLQAANDAIGCLSKESTVTFSNDISGQEDARVEDFINALEDLPEEGGAAGFTEQSEQQENTASADSDDKEKVSDNKEKVSDDKEKDYDKDSKSNSKSKSKSKATKTIKGDSTKTLRSLAGSLASQVKGGLQGAAALPGDIISQIVGEDKTNTEQRDLDQDLNHIEQAVMLRRLVLTDPVLREMPKDQVVSVYNSILAANPDAASDPNLMRLALREAANYEGLTTDAYKQLVDIRKTKVQAEESESKLEADRYKIKGQRKPSTQS